MSFVQVVHHIFTTEGMVDIFTIREGGWGPFLTGSSHRMWATSAGTWYQLNYGTSKYQQ